MAQLQVESIAGNNRVTKMLGKVTVLGTLFLPMNLITGLFGMNVTVPGEQQGNLKWWLGILFFIVGIGVIVFFVCNRFFLDDDAASRIGSSSSVSFKSSAISRLAGGSRRSQANPRLEIRD
jgi:magnesium transporter